MADQQDKSLEHIEKIAAYYDQTGQHVPDKPVITDHSLAAWFLGPKAENREMLTDLMTRAIAAHCDDRELYQPTDPVFVTEEIKSSEKFKETRRHFEDELTYLLNELRGSIPLASYRNQSHMYWDITMPGAVGYLAAMLYNQNNVAVEASPVTTFLEMVVGKQLCTMLGYQVPSTEQINQGAINPWGHITCDGSVANLESMWAARNLKYFPISLAAALKNDESLANAKNFRVTQVSTNRSVLLTDLDEWSLLNLPVDEVINMAPKIQKDYGIPADVISKALDSYNIQTLGMLEFYRRFLPGQDFLLPLVFAPSTAHYSWKKGAAILGLGSNTVQSIHVDLDCRMSMVHLRSRLDECLQKRQPVLQVVAVIGTTEESAVDPLADIVAMREEYRQAGLEFALHIDGAWGGYFASMLRYPASQKEQFEKQVSSVSEFESTPWIMMNDYLRKQYKVFDQADTITVDPHKGGYLPYPAGALCYRNGAMRNLVSFTAPVVFHGGFDPTVGIYGVEGSKPGAAAAGVYLSHQVIPTDATGYGRILGKCFWNSKRLYAQVITMAQKDDPFIVVPVQRLPAEKAGKSEQEIQQQRMEIDLDIVSRVSNSDLLEWFDSNPQSWELFKEIGSDQIIITYSFNFKNDDGSLNTNIEKCNQLNFEIFRKLSLHDYDEKKSYGKVPDTEMFVTQSSFDTTTYGQDFVDHYAQRLGLQIKPGVAVSFLISTTQDPWVSNTADGNFIPELVSVLRKTVIECVDIVKNS